jgi:hypothetical protein
MGPGGGLRAYMPPTSLNWTYTPQWSPTGMNTRQIGPDGNLYVSEGIFRAHSLDPQGNVRWSNLNALPALYYYIPHRRPRWQCHYLFHHGTWRYSGLYHGAAHQRWREAVGNHASGRCRGYAPVRCHGVVAFSPDSRIAYVPATWICYCGRTGYQERGHLLTIQVYPR